MFCGEIGLDPWLFRSCTLRTLKNIQRGYIDRQKRHYETLNRISWEPVLVIANGLGVFKSEMWYDDLFGDPVPSISLEEMKEAREIARKYNERMNEKALKEKALQNDDPR